MSCCLIIPDETGREREKRRYREGEKERKKEGRREREKNKERKERI